MLGQFVGNNDLPGRAQSVPESVAPGRVKRERKRTSEIPSAACTFLKPATLATLSSFYFMFLETTVLEHSLNKHFLDTGISVSLGLPSPALGPEAIITLNFTSSLGPK